MDLEYPPKVFFDRLRDYEVDTVRGIVDFTGQFMASLDNEPYLIAGVGSILRCSDPGDAEDINLAVAGLGFEDTFRGHRFHENVHRFTTIVNAYFTELVKLLGKSRSVQELQVKHARGRYGNLDQRFRMVRGSEILEILSNLGSFTRPYMTKGLRVWYRGGHRDLDVQFCFDKTPEQWRMKQYRGFGGRARQKNGMRTDFLYAVLLEG